MREEKLDFAAYSDELLFCKNDVNFGFRLYDIAMEGPFDISTRVWRETVSSEVTTAGRSKTNSTSPIAEVAKTKFIVDSLQIGQYVNDESIFRSFMSPAKTPEYFLRVVDSTLQDKEVTGKFRYDVNFKPQVDYYYRYPDQFVQTMAKIGGLIGLLKILSFFIAWYHRTLFEASYEESKQIKVVEDVNYSSVERVRGRELGEERFRDKFNYDSFLQLHAQVRDMQEHIFKLESQLASVRRELQESNEGKKDL